MSPTQMLDAMIAALEAERARNPGADLLRAAEVCCDAVRQMQREPRTYCGVCGAHMGEGGCAKCSESRRFMDALQPCAYCGVFDREVVDGEVVAVESGRCNVCARATACDGVEMMPAEGN